MFVKEIVLKSFRNYEAEKTRLCPGRNILIGENAQGKTNFLEAIELIANGYSDRARRDADLIKNECSSMDIQLAFDTKDRGESIHVQWRLERAKGGNNDAGAIEKRLTINGVEHGRMKELQGHLCAVSFKSGDLNLLRGGPKYRRDWLDRIAINLRPSIRDFHTRYDKVIAQKNRLLKAIFEKGSASTQKREELKVWDQQAAHYGAKIIVERIKVLRALSEHAQLFQGVMSGDEESLSIGYAFKEFIHHDNVAESAESVAEETNDFQRSQRDNFGNLSHHGVAPLSSIESLNEKEIEATILRNYREGRYEEISRRQTLCGPHRDDLTFFLNQRDAIAYASQGQQRSLVLSLKLAELRILTECLEETPILILDDVLAELDLNRQALLMSLVDNEMQTIISTTHLSGFRPEWILGAQVLEVRNGRIEKLSDCDSALVPAEDVLNERLQLDRYNPR
jgi:DNA replication and repair protein RecF